MTLDVRLFPCLTDNYGLLVRDPQTGVVATVDTPDAKAILADLDASGWGRLDLILNTHWHPDHTQGNAGLKAETGCEIVGPEEVRRAAPLDRVVTGGDVIMLGEVALEVSETPGHTLGHIVYRAAHEGQAFVGDVLFPLGCGRLLEGTAEQMWQSLQVLASWPDETVIWSAHEYAAANARFGLTLDQRSEMLEQVARIFAARDAWRPTVPTTLEIEKAFNPFLRARDAAEFALRRTAKDNFSG